MNESEDLRAQLASANEARERAEKRGEKAALALTRAHEVIALQRNEINPEKYPEIDDAAGDVLDPCDEMADKLDKALNDLDLTQKALRAAESRAAAAEKERDEARRAIESCTPGGSEFVNDPKACAAFITGARDRAHEMIKRGVVRAQLAESRAERMAKLLREAHPVVYHAANLMTGGVARYEAGHLANRIRILLAKVGE